MCGGIISESLVQLLAMEGIVLPPDVVQRGIDSYVLHMDVGTVRIEPPGREKRIAAVHRGAGPRGLLEARWKSFDRYLLGLAEKQGAKVIRERVDGLAWEDGRPRLSTRAGLSREYDLVVGAYGVNSSAASLFEEMGSGYVDPITTKTFIAEFLLGERIIETYLGSSMHVFLLDLPRLEFAAIIPKGEYATVCLLGRDIDKELVDSFFDTPEVRTCFPSGWSPPRGRLPLFSEHQHRRVKPALRPPVRICRGLRGKPLVQGRNRWRLPDREGRREGRGDPWGFGG
jgi:flavin-dependent dehydrogenase